MGVAVWLLFLNKTYNFVRSSDLLLPSLFLVLAASNTAVSGCLDASTLLLLYSMLMFSILFRCYKAPDATREVFVTATFLAVGSMCDYTFLLLAPFTLIAMGMLGILRFREILAFAMGAAAPYWVGLGFGLITPQDFHMPPLAGMVTGYGVPPRLAWIATGTTILWICSGAAAMTTVVRLYAGNPKSRTFNYIIYLLSLYCGILMLIDAANFPSYLGTVYLCCTVEIANAFALNRMRKPLWLFGFITLAAVGFWIAANIL